MTHVARALGGAPVVLYNVPGRTVVDLSVEAIARILGACPNVCALKDASGNVLRCRAWCAGSATPSQSSAATTGSPCR